MGTKAESVLVKRNQGRRVKCEMLLLCTTREALTCGYCHRTPPPLLSSFFPGHSPALCGRTYRLLVRYPVHSYDTPMHSVIVLGQSMACREEVRDNLPSWPTASLSCSFSLLYRPCRKRPSLCQRVAHFCPKACSQSSSPWLSRATRVTRCRRPPLFLFNQTPSL